MCLRERKKKKGFYNKFGDKKKINPKEKGN